MNAGRGYVIRLYDDKTNKAYYFVGNVQRPRFLRNIKLAQVYTDHASALSDLITIKTSVSKMFKKGYLYISKVFYKEMPFTSNKFIRVPVKLTKPDRYDFLSAI